MNIKKLNEGLKNLIKEEQQDLKNIPGIIENPTKADVVKVLKGDVDYCAGLDTAGTLYIWPETVAGTDYYWDAFDRYLTAHAKHISTITGCVAVYAGTGSVDVADTLVELDELAGEATPEELEGYKTSFMAFMDRLDALGFNTEDARDYFLTGDGLHGGIEDFLNPSDEDEDEDEDDEDE
jgi:hypothetical protein